MVAVITITAIMLPILDKYNDFSVLVNFGFKRFVTRRAFLGMVVVMKSRGDTDQILKAAEIRDVGLQAAGKGFGFRGFGLWALGFGGLGLGSGV